MTLATGPEEEEESLGLLSEDNGKLCSRKERATREGHFISQTCFSALLVSKLVSYTIILLFFVVMPEETLDLELEGVAMAFSAMSLVAAAAQEGDRNSGKKFSRSPRVLSVNHSWTSPIYKFKKKNTFYVTLYL